MAARSWTPTPVDVKALIPQRAAGAPFSATTIPTDTQVANIAAQVTAEVIGEVGEVFAELAEQAKWVATLGTAAYVEQSFWPEQQIGTDTPGQLLYGRYTEALKRLREAAELAAGRSPGFVGTVRIQSATAHEPYFVEDDD